MLSVKRAAGVAPRIEFEEPWYVGEEALYKPGETSPEVQYRGISDPLKSTYVLQFFFLKI